MKLNVYNINIPIKFYVFILWLEISYHIHHYKHPHLSYNSLEGVEFVVDDAFLAAYTCSIHDVLFYVSAEKGRHNY